MIKLTAKESVFRLYSRGVAQHLFNEYGNTDLNEIEADLASKNIGNVESCGWFAAMNHAGMKTTIDILSAHADQIEGARIALLNELVN